MNTTKNYLFYFVHPAKFHLFRYTINELKKLGHQVDIIITGRDILEDLIKKEGWDYKLIFPKGRRIRGVHIYISAVIYLILTVLRLLIITRKTKYDLMISDDLVSFLGRIRKIPTIQVTDDDLSAVPEAKILYETANYIFAPNICDLEKYNTKKLGFDGYKSLAHLHPNVFQPNKDKISNTIKLDTPYFFIRTVSATSTHDVGKRGLTDEVLDKIIPILDKQGTIIINSERELPKRFKKYIFDLNKSEVANYIYHTKIFISDSTTMCAEAAVLGTPAIEIDDWFADFTQYKELNEKYKLLFGFNCEQSTSIIEKITDILNEKNSFKKYQDRRSIMLQDKIDVSGFLFWITNEFPESVDKYMADPNYQKKFCQLKK
jgi:uncharacterized protein